MKVNIILLTAWSKVSICAQKKFRFLSKFDIFFSHSFYCLYAKTFYVRQLFKTGVHTCNSVFVVFEGFLLLFSVEFCVLFTNSILKLYSGFVLVCSSGWQQLCRRRIRGDRIISASCYQVQNEEAERCSGDCRQPCKTDKKVRKVQLIWGGDTQGIHCPAFFFVQLIKKCTRTYILVFSVFHWYYFWSYLCKDSLRT